MKTTKETALHLIECIKEEISSQSDSYLPLYDIYQLGLDYIELLRDIEMEKEMHKRKDH